MASDLDRISEAFRSLAAVAFPDGFLGEVELAVVQAHLDATKVARARDLLAKRGRREAAAILGCSESQVYRLARSRIAGMSAEKESAPG
jgi:hypothetical protein